MNLLDINPRAVRFIFHYIFGSKKPLSLTKQEQLITKIMVSERLAVLLNRRTPFNLSDTFVVYDDICEYIVEKGNYHPNPNIEKTWQYLTSPIQGIVGTFQAKLNPETCLVECSDTWDFNESNFALSLELPALFCFILKWIAYFCFGVNSIVVPTASGRNNYQDLSYKDWSRMPFSNTIWIVFEGELQSLNENKAFTQTWVIDVTGLSCPINDDVKTLQRNKGVFGNYAADNRRCYEPTLEDALNYFYGKTTND